MKAVIATMLAFAIATPAGARTCVIGDSPTNARCRTVIYQSSVAFGRRDTSLVVACNDMVDGTARTVLIVRGGSESLRVRWVDDDTLHVEYSARAKVMRSVPSVLLRDRTLKLDPVPVQGDTGAGCDFEQDDLRNIAS